MRVVPLGTNGFIPSFGRFTMSILVLTEAEALLLDAGTGVARLLEPSVQALLQPYDELHVCLSHYHLDHVVGISYLLGAWSRGTVCIYAPERPFVEAATETLERLVHPPLFPLTLEEFPIPIEVVPVTQAELRIGSLHVRWHPQKHPGGSAGIRIGDAVAYVTDTAVMDTTVAFVQNVRLLLHEVYYRDTEVTPAKLEQEGHSYVSGVARIAREAGVERLMPIHHHPLRSPAELGQVAQELERLAEVPVIVPKEGQVYELRRESDANLPL